MTMTAIMLSRDALNDCATQYHSHQGCHAAHDVAGAHVVKMLDRCSGQHCRHRESERATGLAVVAVAAVSVVTAHRHPTATQAF